MFAAGVLLYNRKKIDTAGATKGEIAAYISKAVIKSLIEAILILGAVLVLAKRGGFLNHGAWPTTVIVCASVCVGLDILYACLIIREMLAKNKSQPPENDQLNVQDEDSDVEGEDEHT